MFSAAHICLQHEYERSKQVSAELERVVVETRSIQHGPTIDEASATVLPKRNNRLRLLLSIVAIAALMSTVAWLTRPSAPTIALGANNSPVPVVLAKAQRENVADYLDGIGTVQASASATVRVRVDGQLQRLYFVEGQDVKAGDVLAQIDPAALQAQLKLAQAQLARDQAALANARSDLKRYSDLVEVGSVAKQTLDTQRAVVAQDEATVVADQAQVDYARVQLDYTTIKAPFSGRTGVRLVDVGNLVRASEATGIVVINQVDPVTLNFTLPEDQFTRINSAIKQSKGKPLAVQALGDSQQVLAEGKLLLLNNQIDATSATIQLKAQFDNRDHQLWPGQFVSARLLLGETRDALVVPAAAVQRGPDGTFVYVYANDKVALQKVTVLRLQGDKAVLAEGLQDEQLVVVDGQSKLRPGATVVEQHLLSAAGSKQ